MKITIEVDDDEVKTLLTEAIAAGTEKAGWGGKTAPAAEPEDDLAGDDKPEEKKVTLTDVQDAIRRAGAVNKEKTKAVLVKHVAKGKEPRGTNLDEAKYQAAIDELAKIK